VEAWRHRSTFVPNQREGWIIKGMNTRKISSVLF